jgi:hypothetical protein
LGGIGRGGLRLATKNAMITATQAQTTPAVTLNPEVFMEIGWNF